MKNTIFTWQKKKEVDEEDFILDDISFHIAQNCVPDDMFLRTLLSNKSKHKYNWTTRDISVIGIEFNERTNPFIFYLNTRSAWKQKFKSSKKENEKNKITSTGKLMIQVCDLRLNLSAN